MWTSHFKHYILTYKPIILQVKKAGYIINSQLKRK